MFSFFCALQVSAQPEIVSIAEDAPPSVVFAAEELTNYLEIGNAVSTPQLYYYDKSHQYINQANLCNFLQQMLLMIVY